MQYSELLARQDRELSKLNLEFRNNRDAIRQMIKGHFDGEAKYGPELARLEKAYERDRDSLGRFHAQEQKRFLAEPQREADKPKVKDMDTAYAKNVTVSMQRMTPETKEERIERKMREWDAAQLEKTQQRENRQERS